MQYALAILVTLMLAGCGNVSFIPDGDPSTSDPETANNSFGCLDGMYSGTYANGNIRGKRLRFPEGYDVTSLTPETIKALVESLCD